MMRARSKGLLAVISLFALLGMPGAGRSQPGGTAGGRRLPEVKSFGMLRSIVHEGKTDAAVSLSALPRRHLVAVGALSGLRGEVTVVDGQFWLAYPDGAGGARVDAKKSSDEQATLLVAANVAAWRRVPVSRAIAFSDLDSQIEALARESGVDTAQPFPIVIEGPLAALEWHVIDGRKAAGGAPVQSHDEHMKMAVKGKQEKTRGTLVGFFSRRHHGVFTHMGSNTHLHVILPRENLTGHVDSVFIGRGATLRLPR